MTDGFNLFWEEVGNKVAGREVKVIVEDSDPEPTGALTKVRRLVEQEKVHTIAGGLLAATGYAIAPYVEQNKIPTIYPVTAPTTSRSASRSAGSCAPRPRAAGTIRSATTRTSAQARRVAIIAWTSRSAGRPPRASSASFEDGGARSCSGSGRR